MKAMRFFAAVVLVCVLAGGAEGEIVGGTITVIDPPLNTGNDNQQVTALLGFNERQHVLLASDLAVDWPGGVIAAGTVVSSHYIIYDPPTSSAVHLTGTAVFDTNVIGLIYKTDKLNDSDYLGLPTVNYLNPSMRGFESADSAAVPDPNTVSFDLQAGTPGDYARVITVSGGASRGPQVVMRSPQVMPGGVHTNETGVGSVRLLFDEALIFDSGDVAVKNEANQTVTAYATGSGSAFMVITFEDVLLTDRYTITVKDTALSAVSGAAIDGDNDGEAGGDSVFVMEHRERQDSDNDDDIDLFDLAGLAAKWLWSD